MVHTTGLEGMLAVPYSKSSVVQKTLGDEKTEAPPDGTGATLDQKIRPKEIELSIELSKSENGKPAYFVKIRGNLYNITEDSYYLLAIVKENGGFATYKQVSDANSRLVKAKLKRTIDDLKSALGVKLVKRKREHGLYIGDLSQLMKNELNIINYNGIRLNKVTGYISKGSKNSTLTESEIGIVSAIIESGEKGASRQDILRYIGIENPDESKRVINLSNINSVLYDFGVRCYKSESRFYIDKIEEGTSKIEGSHITPMQVYMEQMKITPNDLATPYSGRNYDSMVKRIRKSGRVLPHFDESIDPLHLSDVKIAQVSGLDINNINTIATSRGVKNLSANPENPDATTSYNLPELINALNVKRGYRSAAWSLALYYLAMKRNRL